jgi:hypothetical protein
MQKPEKNIAATEVDPILYVWELGEGNERGCLLVCSFSDISLYLCGRNPNYVFVVKA